jgi:hypothetical protein
MKKGNPLWFHFSRKKEAAMRFTLFALLGTTMLARVAIQAHHGYSAFERENTVTIEGNIEEIKYMNPHSILIVKTTDSQTYTVEWLSLPQLRRAGINYDTLKKGDHVVLNGAPARDPAVPKMSIVRNLKRTSDGWNWPAPTQLHK